MFRGSAASGGSVRRTAEADASLPEAERMRGAQRFAAAYIAMVDELEQQALTSRSSSSSGSGGGTGGGGSNGSAAQTLGCVELCALR